MIQYQSVKNSNLSIYLLWSTWVTFDFDYETDMGWFTVLKHLPVTIQVALFSQTKLIELAPFELTSEHSLALRRSQRIETKILILFTWFYQTEMKELFLVDTGTSSSVVLSPPMGCMNICILYSFTL